MGIFDFFKKQKTTVIPDNNPEKVLSQQSNKAYERHRVAGTSYRKDAIISLGTKNNDYELNKSQLIKKNLIDTPVYEYVFNPSSVSLVPEPDNEHDANAIKVILDGVHVGYIKKGSCSHVKNLLSSNKIQSISAKIFGGNCKYVRCYDDCGDKDSYTLEKEKSDFGVEITLLLN